MRRCRLDPATPVDEATAATPAPDISGWVKRDELPYDFIRERLSIVAERDGEVLLITKGAVDKVLEARRTSPWTWNVSSTRQFMLGFGRISSVFDYVTFGVLLVILRASAELFRSGWFVESVVSASLIVARDPYPPPVLPQPPHLSPY